MDWVGLDPDLLRIIAKKVGDISNFIRLRAVCKQWRSALPPSDQPSQLPWFIQCISNSDSSFKFQFFSLYSNRTHTLPFGGNARLAVSQAFPCVMPSLSDQYYSHFDHLIDAGDYLLGVKPIHMTHPNYSIEVYRLERAAKDSCWIKMNGGIGGRVLILDFRHGFCLNASDFDGFKGNCIYFMGYYYIQDNQHVSGIIRYDMETSQKQLLHNCDIFSGAWFVPSLC